MTERRSLRLAGTGALAFIVATAICATSCSSTKPQSPGMDLTSMHLSPAPAGSCKIDAVKMCQVTGGLAGAAPSSQPAAMPTASSYAARKAPESVEFQIPMGQTIELKCYYDLQHNAIYRADATAESALTRNSVEYMKQRGLCINK
ncbi:MAG: hypothetical protein ABSB13_11985 [Candidatus Binatus sp.]|jgi:hypothetical protein|uniref:hypothetical protein n=1 Tax=Candidatus Binatus sp. TaxID=2811406 RepID=UPI003D144427